MSSSNISSPSLVPLHRTSITHQTPNYLKEYHYHSTTPFSLNTLSNVSLGIPYPIENFVTSTILSIKQKKS